MALIDAKEYARTLARLIEMDRDPVEYWRSQCLEYWHHYLVNQALIQHLRKQNRIMRQFLGDLIPPELAAEMDRKIKTVDPTLN